MGISCLGRRSWSTYDGYVPAANSGNPNPLNFLIEKIEQVGNHVVAMIKYIGVTNYEGKKILVFTNQKAKTIQKLTSIDPHFSNNPEYISPFARFEPTINGWNAAIFLCERIK